MDNQKITKIEITHRTIIFTILFLIGLYLLFLIKDIIVLLIISLLLMVALNPLATKLERNKIPRSLSIAIVYFLFFGLIILAIATLVPPLVNQIVDLVSQLNIPPRLIDSFHYSNFNLQDIQVILNQFSSVPKIIDIVISAFSLVFVTFTISVITFYLLMERRNLHKTLVWFFGSNQAEKKAEQFIDQLELRIGSWVRGQVFLMFFVGILTYIGLTLLNIPYALPLAIAAGILEIVPGIGPFISAIPAVAIAYFTTSPTMALIVAILYIVVQQIENNLLVPTVMKKSAGINPIITIFTLLIGFRLGGVIGAVLAIPIFIVIKVTISEIYKLRQNQDLE